jgi:hypothetical protein
MARFLFSDGISVLKQLDISSQINGITDTFSLSESIDQSSLRVYYNGLRQSPDDISFNSNTSFSLSFTPQIGDSLFIDYVVG